jgi:anti-sigma B factor antagonist
MKFSVEKNEKYTLITLVEGKLNSLVSPQLKSELILLNKEEHRNVILDLSAVKYADSSGLSSLLIGHRLCKSADGLFIITAISDAVSRLLTISQLENIITILPTVDEAIDFIFMEELEKDLNKDIE